MGLDNNCSAWRFKNLNALVNCLRYTRRPCSILILARNKLWNLIRWYITAFYLVRLNLASMTTGLTHWSTLGGLWGVQKRCIGVFQNQEYPYGAVSGVNHDIQSFFLKNYIPSLGKSLSLARMGLEFVLYKPCKTDWLVHKWCYFSSCKAPFWVRWRWRSTASTMDVGLKTTDFWSWAST